MGGIMDLKGEKEREKKKIGVEFEDIFKGIYRVIEIKQEIIMRESKGKGKNIDMELFD